MIMVQLKSMGQWCAAVLVPNRQRSGRTLQAPRRQPNVVTVDTARRPSESLAPVQRLE
jgi:hypothetical protein